MIAFGTVLLFSLIQSLFGMGLLVFGTPTLLLIGLDFSEALAMLLPASITISCLQVLEDRFIEPKFARAFVLWCLPSMSLALVIHLRYEPNVPIEFALASIMFTFASLRLLPQLSSWVHDMVRTNSNTWMMLMGVVHGLSNLGGAVLSVVAGAHFTDKFEIRRAIAFCYLSFAIFQILILLFLRPGIFGWNNLLTMVLAGTVYISLGRRTFRVVPQITYGRLFVLFMLVYALILFGKGLKLF